MSAGFVGTLFIYSAGSDFSDKKLVKYSRQNMVAISLSDANTSAEFGRSNSPITRYNEC